MKLASALGMALSELLSNLENGEAAPRRRRKASRERAINPERRLFEIKTLMKRLSHQRAAMDRTFQALEELASEPRSSS